MFGKLKEITADAVASGKEKLAEATSVAVNEFLKEISALQPILAKANIKFGGYRLTLSVPPSFEIINSPGMDWNLNINKDMFEGVSLTKYQEMIINSLLQVSSYSKNINSFGFKIGKVDFTISLPPSIVIEIVPQEIYLDISSIQKHG
jgi:hypothetical protein